MISFDNEVKDLKQTSRFKKLDGKTPTKAELKAPWTCLTLGS
jgi:hypothetical protein